jgi:hypothetical protein
VDSAQPVSYTSARVSKKKKSKRRKNKQENASDANNSIQQQGSHSFA